MTNQPLRSIEQELAAGGTVIIDGATGTELERRGADMHKDAWCAMATLSSPELLQAIHADYIRAGARVVTANTFSTNRNMLEPAGLGDQFETLNRRAVHLARRARAACGADDRVAVAGSMSHQIPVTPGADQRDPGAVPEPALAEANFREMASLLADCGVDLILMEMMSDPQLAVPAIRAALETGLPVWVGLSLRATASGPVSYACPEIPAADLFDQIPLDGVRVAGLMHSSLNTIHDGLAGLKQRWSGPLMAYPDSGYFEMPNWRFVDVATPAELVDHSLRWAADGVQVMGGCCGLGVDHIRAVAAAHKA